MTVVPIETNDFYDRHTIRELIQDARERIEDPDPRAIAKVVAEQLSPEDLQDIAVPLLAAVVREQVRRDRHDLFHRSDAPTSAKWAQARESAENGALKALRMQWCVEGEWMYLADMRKTHLEWLRDDYLKRAAEHEAWANRFDRLARKARNKTVAELSPAVIESAWNDNA